MIKRGETTSRHPPTLKGRFSEIPSRRPLLFIGTKSEIHVLAKLHDLTGQFSEITFRHPATFKGMIQRDTFSPPFIICRDYSARYLLAALHYLQGQIQQKYFSAPCIIKGQFSEKRSRRSKSMKGAIQRERDTF